MTDLKATRKTAGMNQIQLSLKAGFHVRLHVCAHKDADG